MSKSETCVGCQKQSPLTETDYTLISTNFGWRLTRKVSAEGTLVLEWRCPACWSEYKRSRPEVATTPSEAAQTGRRRKLSAEARPPGQLAAPSTGRKARSR